MNGIYNIPYLWCAMPMCSALNTKLDDAMYLACIFLHIYVVVENITYTTLKYQKFGLPKTYSIYTEIIYA